MSFDRASLRMWEWVRVAALAALLAWTTASLGGYLAGTRGVAAMLTAGLLAIHLLAPGPSGRTHPGGWLWIPFLLYAAVNVAWVTPVGWLGWMDWWEWVQTAAIYWVVLNGVRSGGPRRGLLWCLAAIGTGASFLACYQHWFRPDWLMLHRTQLPQFIGRSGGPFGIPNSLAALMMLLMPSMAAIAFARARLSSARGGPGEGVTRSGFSVPGAGGRREGPPRPRVAQRIAAAAVLVVLAVGFVFAFSRGAWIAFAGALALQPLFARGRSVGRRLLHAAALVALIAGAGVALYSTVPLMKERFDLLVRQAGEKTRPVMWRGAWEIFKEHPWFGGGAGAYDILFEAHRPEGYRDEPVWAHNDYLNTLADYGGAGFALLAAASVVTIVRCRAGAGRSAALGIGILAFALQLLMDFHLKIPALAMAFAALSGLWVGGAWPLAPDPSDTSPASRRFAGPFQAAVALAAIALVGGWIFPRFQAEHVRWAAREKIDRMAVLGTTGDAERRVLAVVRPQFSMAVARDPSNGQAWSDSAYADSLWALVEPSLTGELGRQVAAEADRAIALCAVNPEFWVRKGTGLDMQARWADGGDCFARALELGPARAGMWYYEAYHLSLDPAEKDSALAALSFCLRLDPGFGAAQSLRQRLATGSPVNH